MPGLGYRQRFCAACKELAEGLILARVRRWSLRFRLSVLFSIFLFLIWLVVGILSWYESSKQISRFYDSEQLLFAKKLLMANLQSSELHLKRNKEILSRLNRDARGNLVRRALAFAIFDKTGRRIMDDGEKGRHFYYGGQEEGFCEMLCEKDPKLWRVLWLRSDQDGRLVAVGQEVQYRKRMTMKMLQRQLWPWLLLLPVPLLALFWLLKRELAPLAKTAAHLQKRSPADFSPLPPESVPQEVRPLLLSLNALFERMAVMLQHERAFVADAAHELRTPLSGLRIQAEVQSTTKDPKRRQQAAQQMLMAIDRCDRLVEQLLTLSRLESMGVADRGTLTASAQYGRLDWETLLDNTLEDIRPQAENRSLTLTCMVHGLPCLRHGDSLLLAILLRNILHNAVKYTPSGGRVSLSLTSDRLMLENDSSEIPPQELSRLGEAFFRPPGQVEIGCGLGLSIASKIAALHGCTLHIGQYPQEEAALIKDRKGRHAGTIHTVDDEDDALKHPRYVFRITLFFEQKKISDSSYR